MSVIVKGKLQSRPSKKGCRTLFRDNHIVRCMVGVAIWSSSWYGNWSRTATRYSFCDVYRRCRRIDMGRSIRNE